MFTLVRMELFKLMKRPMTWMLLALMSVGTGIADLIVMRNLSGVSAEARAGPA